MKMRPYKILVITPQYAPDFGPSAPIYTALCEDLQQSGCDVTVVTGFPHYAGSEAWYRYSGKSFVEEVRNGVRVIRTYVYNVPKSSLWRRLLYHASFNLFATLASLRAGKADVILADAPTLWSGLPLLIKSILPRVPFIYIVHDIYPDVLVRLGVLHNPRLVNFIETIEGFFYTRSVQVSVLSDGFKANLLKKGVKEEKVTIIPACTDTEFIRPLPRENELRQSWDLNGKFVVLYAGNMGLSQGLETVLRAAQALKNYQDIVFVLVGEGATKSSLQEIAEREELCNVKILSFLPREQVPSLYSIADVSLVSLKRDIVVESVPSKTYTIMASGRPIVATLDPNTETGLLLEKAHCGICVEPENASAMAKAILRLYEDESLRTEMGRRGRDFVVENYSRQVATKLYLSLIQRFSKAAQS